MQDKLKELTHTARTILIIAAAIVVAILLWKIIAFTLGIIATIIEIAALAAVLYVIFLIARSSLSKRNTPSGKGKSSIFG